MDMSKYKYSSGYLHIASDDGTMLCVPEDVATSEERQIIAQLKADMEANPVGRSLEEAKLAKDAELKEAYRTELESGFTSEACGKPVKYGYRQTPEHPDQFKFAKLSLQFLRGTCKYPLPVPAEDGSISVFYSEVEVNKLLDDIEAFEWGLQMKLHNLDVKRLKATTVEEVEAIKW